jgi:spore maturation protein CgeB
MGTDNEKVFMKIAVFDTNNHPTPIFKEWGYGFLDLGHEVDFYPTEHHSIRSATNHIYDLIVYVGGMDLLDFEFVKNHNPNVKIVCSTDCIQPFHQQFIGLIDFFITTQHQCPELIKQFGDIGFKMYHVPLAGNNHLFQPVNCNKQYDACFIGTLAHGYREEDKYLYPYVEKYNFYLAGMTYKNYGIPFLPYDQSNMIRNQSKININFHYDYQRDNEGHPADRVDLNQSVYNIALSGAFQLCDHPLVSELFDGSIVTANWNEWPELFDYYLNNETERVKFATKSYEIAIEHHTWKARMREFLQILNTHR